MHTADAGLEVRIPVKAGEHEVGVSFVSRSLGAGRHPATAARRASAARPMSIITATRRWNLFSSAVLTARARPAIR